VLEDVFKGNLCCLANAHASHGPLASLKRCRERNTLHLQSRKAVKPQMTKSHLPKLCSLLIN
jgi:hypothetical protein